MEAQATRRGASQWGVIEAGKGRGPLTARWTTTSIVHMPQDSMPFAEIELHRFKQFRDAQIQLQPGLTLVAGGNNSGKSTLLQALAIWEFCRTAIEQEKGQAALFTGASGQGIGLGDDEFSPINVPTLRHLWTNLKTQKESGEPDGYTLRVRTRWSFLGSPRTLEFGLALANDRLFVRTTDSSVSQAMEIPRIAYLPPFAGITDRETLLTGAIRRRRIGEGLSGAVLRNILLDMFEANAGKRRQLRDPITRRINTAELKRLRTEDAWELVQDALRRIFGAELIVTPFHPEYHSYINIEVHKGVVKGYQLKRHARYAKRDLMVEGSGFLQWLSVLALATNPDVDALLLDEPDAHLHPALQQQLVDEVASLAERTGKQVLLATHSPALLAAARPESVLEIRQGSKPARYLDAEKQKVALLAGLGTEYAPRIDGAKRTERVFFFEGPNDIDVLRALATTLGEAWPSKATPWQNPTGHRERRQLFLGLQTEIPNLRALSLRDRDDDAPATVDSELTDLGVGGSGEAFIPKKWRRRTIENYLLHPPTIAAVAGTTSGAVDADLKDHFALAVGDSFASSDAPQGLLDARGKDILKHFGVSPKEVASRLPPEAVPDDIKTFLSAMASFCDDA